MKDYLSEVKKFYKMLVDDKQSENKETRRKKTIKKPTRGLRIKTRNVRSKTKAAMAKTRGSKTKASSSRTKMAK